MNSSFKQTDIIKIEDLKIYAYHGVYDFENRDGQNFYVSATLYGNFQKAALTDELSDTVNYAEVVDIIIKYTASNVFGLIEKLADGLATRILNEYKAIDKIVVEVKKPEAPIDREFKNISAVVERERHKAYIAYGSNMGESENIINSAKEMINESNHSSIKKESSMIRTTPYGNENQPTFLNGVWELETYLSPENLLEYLHEVEHEHKRERKEHWGPRTLDLDIVLYDDIVYDSENLVIPHKDMKNRDFVLEPLAEIAGFLRHPVTNKTIDEMVTEVREKHIIS